MYLQTLDDEPVASGKDYQWQNRPVSEWTNLQVCHWLMGMNMDQYTQEFTAKAVDGQQLLHLDSDRLKVRWTTAQPVLLIKIRAEFPPKSCVRLSSGTGRVQPK